MHSAPVFDLFRLRVFLTVVRQSSLTAAGLQLGLPQPVVSRHLARLESDFGGRLFERHGRGVKLSELGQQMLPKVEHLIQDADDLAEEIARGVGVPSGEVRIGMLPSVRSLLTVPLFFRMQQEFPSIRLVLLEGSGHQIDQWLRNGQVDIGLPYKYGRYADQQLDPLLSFDSYLVGQVGDAITATATVDFAMLEGLPLLLPAAPSDFRLKLDQISKQQHVGLNVIMEADSGQVQRDIVALGGGYTVSTWHAISDAVQRGKLQASKIVNPEVSRSISLGYPATKSVSRAVKAVAAAIRQLIGSAEVKARIQRAG